MSKQSEDGWGFPPRGRVVVKIGFKTKSKRAGLEKLESSTSSKKLSHSVPCKENCVQAEELERGLKGIDSLMDVVVASGINQNWTHLGVPSLPPSLPAMCTRYTQNKNAGMYMYVCFVAIEC